MMRSSRLFLLVIVGLLLTVLQPPVASASHWVIDTDVELSPLETKANRTVNFQITVRNSGNSPLTVCRVEIRFEWNTSPREVFSGLVDVPGGGSRTWQFSEAIPPRPPMDHTYTATVSANPLELPPDLPCGSSDWMDTIRILPNSLPVAWFAFAPSNPPANTTVYFHDQSSDPDGTIVAWDWSFGDGEYAHGREETHQFASSGSYPVVLTVTDDDGAKNTTSRTVAVAANARPQAAFSFTPTNPRIGTTVQFTDESADSEGTIDSWFWTFGDMTNSTARDPTHLFMSSGIHIVRLAVTDDQDSTGFISQDVMIIGNQAPVSDFSFSPGNPDTNTDIQFTDTSSDPDGLIVAWNWDFGDGNVSTERSPSHRFQKAGEFQVSVRVTDNEGSANTRTRTVRIAAVPSGNEPQASGLGYMEWGLIAAGVAAIAVAMGVIVRRRARPRRKWGQAHNHTPPPPKSRWRPR